VVFPARRYSPKDVEPHRSNLPRRRSSPRRLPRRPPMRRASRARGSRSLLLPHRRRSCRRHSHPWPLHHPPSLTAAGAPEAPQRSERRGPTSVVPSNSSRPRLGTARPLVARSARWNAPPRTFARSHPRPMSRRLVRTRVAGSSPVATAFERAAASAWEGRASTRTPLSPRPDDSQGRPRRL
jgi:hypothetical protein